MATTKSKNVPSRAVSDFIALSDAEKERIFQEIEREDPRDRLARSKPLDPRTRALWEKAKRKGGRPKLGKDGVKVISLSVEKKLLNEADAYAKKNGLKRAELFSQALRSVLSKRRAS
jgi:hypothetical protein